MYAATWHPGRMFVEMPRVETAAPDSAPLLQTQPFLDSMMRSAIAEPPLSHINVILAVVGDNIYDAEGLSMNISAALAACQEHFWPLMGVLILDDGRGPAPSNCTPGGEGGRGNRQSKEAMLKLIVENAVSEILGNVPHDDEPLMAAGMTSRLRAYLQAFSHYPCCSCVVKTEPIQACLRTHSYCLPWPWSCFPSDVFWTKSGMRRRW